MCFSGNSYDEFPHHHILFSSKMIASPTSSVGSDPATSPATSPLTTIPAFPDVRTATHFPLPESSWMEYKQTLHSCTLDKVFATLCGLLNGGGGYMVFGVRDSDGLITGVPAIGMAFDVFIRSIDNIYHSRCITTIDDPTKNISVGAVTTARVSAVSGTKHLLVITVRPEAGKVYQFGTTIWHRLGASNFCETTSKIESPTSQIASLQAERDRLTRTITTLQSERDSARGSLAALRSNYTTLVSASKGFAKRIEDTDTEITSLRATVSVMEEETKTLSARAIGAEKEATDLHATLFASILHHKMIAEEKLVSKRETSLLSYLLCF